MIILDQLREIQNPPSHLIQRESSIFPAIIRELRVNGLLKPELWKKPDSGFNDERYAQLSQDPFGINEVASTIREQKSAWEYDYLPRNITSIHLFPKLLEGLRGLMRNKIPT